ncbi:ATP-binding protein [Oceanomicrobium pacificus]|uniref:Histidine kinase/HSP90-like ATPase domain-containing protein n=1 Tax=Oceanomicrobium pacificus TaxID=2692916 RepID=A0A6B0TPP6_9RHOB|nr:ATP-binding protein [Oceanomicrobium pacificus]MXU64629.1 hypothetical protein [Oceanomicrobium pacificus]
MRTDPALPRHFDWQFQSDLRRVSEIAAAIGRLIARTPAWADRQEEVELVSAELLTNLSRHAYGGTAGPIDLTMTLAPSFLRLRSEDRGRPFRAPDAKPPAENPNSSGTETLREGGFGLSIIHEIADTVSYARNGQRNIWTLTLVRERAKAG